MKIKINKIKKKMMKMNTNGQNNMKKTQMIMKKLKKNIQRNQRKKKINGN